MDAIKLSGKKPTRSSGSSAIMTLEKNLRKFFDEADGHGSLYRKPPPTMMTPKYFEIARNVTKKIYWVNFVNSTSYKEKLQKSEEAFKENARKAAELAKIKAKAQSTSNSCKTVIAIK